MHTCLGQIPADTERVFVAYSGGLDSSVLLHLVNRIADREFEIIAWHVNHGLIEAADAMETFCIEQAQSFGIELRIDRLRLQRLDSNIESEARRQRYALFARHTRRGDCILTAHHSDDQAETFLLNALRGAGSAGLRGIAPQRWLGDALLLRPLIFRGRGELETYARQHEIAWFNDPSNRSNRFDRNYLRNEVAPKLRQRWPRFHASLATCAQIQAETQDLLDEIAAADFDAARAAPADGVDTLGAEKLRLLSPGRRHNLVRYWIAKAGYGPLSLARLRELMQQLNARPDASPKIAMPGYAIRIYDRRLFLVPEKAGPDCDAEYSFGRAELIDIDVLDLHFTRAEIFSRLDLEDRNQSLVLKFRRRGETNRDRHRLKRLFQTQRVPPWRRGSVAQVYLDGRLEGLLP